MSTDNPMYEPEKWFHRKTAQRCVEALRKNGFTAHYADTKDEARRIVLEAIPVGSSVGIGGSVTIRDLGIPEALKARGNRLYDHWDPSLSPAEKTAARDNQVRADVFLSSTNAITVDGALVNTDGTGNRVASMIFGPKTSVIVCGHNKIVPDVHAAICRIREYAAPVNYKRLNAAAPCVAGDACDGCSPKSCRITTIIEAKPGAKEEFVVVVVGERLGY